MLVTKTSGDVTEATAMQQPAVVRVTEGSQFVTVRVMFLSAVLSFCGQEKAALLSGFLFLIPIIRIPSPG